MAAKVGSEADSLNEISRTRPIPSSRELDALMKEDGQRIQSEVMASQSKEIENLRLELEKEKSTREFQTSQLNLLRLELEKEKSTREIQTRTINLFREKEVEKENHKEGEVRTQEIELLRQENKSLSQQLDTTKETLRQLATMEEDREKLRQKLELQISHAESLSEALVGVRVSLQGVERERDALHQQLKTSDMSWLLSAYADAKKKQEEEKTIRDNLLLELTSIKKKQEEENTIRDNLLLELSTMKKKQEEESTTANSLLLELSNMKKKQEEESTIRKNLLLELNNTKKHLEEESTASNKLLLEHAVSVGRLNEELVKTHAELKQAVQDKDKVYSLLEEARNKSQEKDERIRKLQEVSNVKEENTKRDEEVMGKLKVEVTRLKGELGDLRDSLTAAREERETLLRRIASMEWLEVAYPVALGQVDEETAARDNLRTEVTRLNADVTRLNAELANSFVSQEELTRLRNELSQAIREKEELNRNLQKFSTVSDELRRQSQGKDEVVSQLRGEVLRMTDERSRLEEVIRVLRRDGEKLSSERDGAVARLVATCGVDERSRLEEVIRVLREDCAQLSSERDQAVARFVASRDANRNNDDFANCHAITMCLEEENQRLVVENRRLREDYDALHATLLLRVQELENSERRFAGG